MRATLFTNHTKKHARFWMVIRGVEAYPVVLGDMVLLAEARVRIHRFRNLTQPHELVTLADVPAGTSGALLNVRFDPSANPFFEGVGFLEACMRALIDGATTPMFLSSGAEYYFLSAFWHH